jgi:hypothetical protein
MSDLNTVYLFMPDVSVLYRREVVFSYSAERANPIIGNILKRCSGSYAAIRISHLRIIYISTCITYILLHNSIFC